MKMVHTSVKQLLLIIEEAAHEELSNPNLYFSPCPYVIQLLSNILFLRKKIMKFIFIIMISILLTSCASYQINSSTLNNISIPKEYHANGKKIFIEYSSINIDPYVNAPLESTEYNKRLDEIKQLLIQKGFTLVEDINSSDLKLKITEKYDPDKLNNVALYFLTSFSFTVIPSFFEDVYSYKYEIYNKNQIQGNLNNQTSVKKIFGLVAIPMLAISVPANLQKKARLQSHEQALADFIEQGIL